MEPPVIWLVAQVPLTIRVNWVPTIERPQIHTRVDYVELDIVELDGSLGEIFFFDTLF